MNSNKIKETVENIRGIVIDLIKMALEKNSEALKEDAVRPECYNLFSEGLNKYEYPSDFFEKDSGYNIEKFCSQVDDDGAYFIDYEEGANAWNNVEYRMWAELSTDTLVEITELIEAKLDEVNYLKDLRNS